MIYWISAKTNTTNFLEGESRASRGVSREGTGRARDNIVENGLTKILLGPPQSAAPLEVFLEVGVKGKWTERRQLQIS